MIRSRGSSSDERLRRIEAITDATLSQLRSQDLLDVLLDRVCDLMDVDTAVVLLLDAHAQQLVATAAKGLEVEVEQGFRLAVGRGFAGRVARDRTPVVIPDLSVADIANPLLREKGLSSLLGVPMLAAGELVGVLHVGSLAPREFSEGDIQLLQLVAERATLAAQVRTSEIDRMAALALQRSLLPSRLPGVPGLELAARYLPGHDTGVGGDWYDVFHLPSGWLGVVIGDVSGHGLPSAVVMGRLRSALRAYSLECDDPADALARLDRKIHHFEAGSLATVLYGMISPDREQVVISLAGHPPPVLAPLDREAQMVRVPTDLPLGTGRPERRRSTTVDLPAGAVLVCYTDGLVERRGEYIDLGLERLRLAVEPGPAEVVCATVISAVAAELPTDDVALLAIRRP
ncbi:PP2C family protein-serine/threonine phosphatase [Micromonospora sp. CPCC 206061]|uniref:PP2C family protein-serine/threonine phosphatase n=1 Tax=Micromonospora sp. CPCC 206061 TaxID=3122410 RepID=UPI002FEE6EF3